MAAQSTPLDALFAHGLNAHKQGLLDEAEASYRRFLHAKPGHPEAMRLLAHIEMSRNRFPQAESLFRKVVASAPDWANFYNLGYVLHHQGKQQEAVRAYLQSLACEPDSVSARYNLAVLRGELGQFVEAESDYREVLRLKPDHLEALNNLGLLWVRLHRQDEAEQAFRRAAKLVPVDVGTLNNLATLLTARRHYREAAAIFRQVVELAPGYAHAAGKLAFVRRQLCDWQDLEKDDSRVKDLLTHGTSGIAPFECLASPLFTPEQLREAGRLYAEAVCGSTLSMTPLVDPVVHPMHGRLRIGYLSADFHAHPVVFLLLSVLESHDREHFTVSIYSYGPTSNDAYRQKIESLGNPFRDLSGHSDLHAAQVIAADEVDILIDLNGFTGETRPGIVAWRPAPVIVNWLGYPGSMGHSRLADYIIGDPVLTPPEYAHNYSESLALMPHCYQPNDDTQTIGNAPARSEAGLPEKGFVFCCFNQSYKITPERFSLWCRLLRAVPGSVLWLLQPSFVAVDNLREEANAHGVEASRLIFSPALPLADHLGRLQLADLALDTFPYTSGATCSNALWAGVPLISRIGETYVGRMAASLLLAMGLPELVTESDEAYFELAHELAISPTKRQVLRLKLARQRVTSPLFNTQRFTRDLEKLYQDIWKRHGQGERSQVIS